MLTGFQGMHVALGSIMLLVIAFRCMAGHFTPGHHFGFEAVAWYWHFVDVVWLGLFRFVWRSTPRSKKNGAEGPVLI